MSRERTPGSGASRLVGDKAGIALVEVDDEWQWDGLVEAHPAQTGFHRWQFLQGQSRISGWDFRPLIAVQGDVRIGVVPLLVRRALPRRSVAPPYPYVGPLVVGELLDEVLAALRRWQRRSGLLRARFGFAPAVSAQARGALQAAGMRSQADSTFLVDLSHGSTDRLIARYSSTRRTDLRRSERRGVVVRASEPGEIAALLPALLQEQYDNHGAPSPYPSAVGAEAERLLREMTGFHSYTALVGDRPAGIALTIDAGDTAYGWIAGGFRADRSLQVGSALQHADLNGALERGRSSYDLVGYVDRRVADWKRSFGGVETAYAHGTSDLLPRGLTRMLSPVMEGTRDRRDR